MSAGERARGTERVWVVDRVRGDVAVLVEDDSGAARNVPLGSLPGGTREGDVLRVPVDAAGEPEWTAARADERLRDERLDEARAALDRLRRRDPGGDVKL
ncbi:MAG: DUF3006 domain-containing protein [Gemmatimonadales bacterium]